ncbi:hypothetical protein, partial [Sulfitobacter sp. MOLA879]|uniref:hypothetical protein n=1 Tax=Sulfitobacter sp. MOLA879 TaxID=3368579 RepID=UPI003746F43E
ASDDTQKSHVDHSKSPQPKPSGQCVHMGQFSVTIYGATGSALSDNQQAAVTSPYRSEIVSALSTWMFSKNALKSSEMLI